MRIADEKYYNCDRFLLSFRLINKLIHIWYSCTCVCMCSQRRILSRFLRLRLSDSLLSTTLHLFQLTIQHPHPFAWTAMLLSFTFFVWSGSTRALPMVLLLSLSQVRHSESMCTSVSFSARYFLHDDDDDFIMPFWCSIYLRLAFPLQSLTSDLQGFLSSWARCKHMWLFKKTIQLSQNS